eukprot:5745823-Pleurochrysis_carterae.AAC.1
MASQRRASDEQAAAQVRRQALRLRLETYADRTRPQTGGRDQFASMLLLARAHLCFSSVLPSSGREEYSERPCAHDALVSEMSAALEAERASVREAAERHASARADADAAAARADDAEHAAQ